MRGPQRRRTDRPREHEWRRVRRMLPFGGDGAGRRRPHARGHHRGGVLLAGLPLIVGRWRGRSILSGRLRLWWRRAENAPRHRLRVAARRGAALVVRRAADVGVLTEGGETGAALLEAGVGRRRPEPWGWQPVGTRAVGVAGARTRTRLLQSDALLLLCMLLQERWQQ